MLVFIKSSKTISTYLSPLYGVQRIIMYYQGHSVDDGRIKASHAVCGQEHDARVVLKGSEEDYVLVVSESELL